MNDTGSSQTPPTYAPLFISTLVMPSTKFCAAPPRLFLIIMACWWMVRSVRATQRLNSATQARIETPCWETSKEGSSYQSWGHLCGGACDHVVGSLGHNSFPAVAMGPLRRAQDAVPGQGCGCDTCRTDTQPLLRGSRHRACNEYTSVVGLSGVFHDSVQVPQVASPKFQERRYRDLRLFEAPAAHCQYLRTREVDFEALHSEGGEIHESPKWPNCSPRNLWPQKCCSCDCFLASQAQNGAEGLQ